MATLGITKKQSAHLRGVQAAVGRLSRPVVSNPYPAALRSMARLWGTLYGVYALLRRDCLRAFAVVGTCDTSGILYTQMGENTRTKYN